MRGCTDDDLAEKFQAALESALPENTAKALKKHVDNILYDLESDIMYRLKEDLAPNLTAFVREMAEKAVTALLEGREDTMRAYLSCNENGWTGRSTGYTARGASDMHPVIHGQLFETGFIELRKKIVDAHRELLVNERILDLEDQVKSLVDQVNKANAEKDRMWERLKELQ
jgi:hypothetical protein